MEPSQRKLRGSKHFIASLACFVSQGKFYLFYEVQMNALRERGSPLSPILYKGHGECVHKVGDFNKND